MSGHLEPVDDPLSVVRESPALSMPQPGALPAALADWHILAAATPADERTRVLKHGETFAVFDRYGDVRPGGLGEAGLYHEGTRYLSCLLLDLEGNRPFFIGSTVRDQNDQLIVALTNHDLFRDGLTRVPVGTLHLSLKKFLWEGACYQRLRIHNYGLEPVETTLVFHVAADYADIFQVRGLARTRRGQDLAPVVGDDGRLTLGYRGLDDLVRRTHFRFDPPPESLTPAAARFAVRLKPQEQMALEMTVACERQPARVTVRGFEAARHEAEADLKRSGAWACALSTSNGQVNAWIDRAVSDLHMLTTRLDTGPYPYAGVPWFNTQFGRDGIVTALECLWLRPELACGVLNYLAKTQARGENAAQDAEPGKILHETRRGEMARLKEIPFGCYYGSVDSTPLFVMLAGAYYERTGDRALVERLWPNVEAALAWVDRYGDPDGDGFVEYARRSRDGLIQQGWKDSDDAVFHADGTIAHGPIALCEVQGYVYAARRAGALLARALGHDLRAQQLEAEAETLRERFEEAFWCEDLGTYALALDGDKRPCRVVTSNAGQCLYTGIVHPERAHRVAYRLLAAESFSGWGVRTIASTEARYNPMAYHNGSVWPHDNALIAQGLARYGHGDQALQLLEGMFEASHFFDLRRMPELFCGFPHQPGEGPVHYPLACAPQAWSAASVFLLFQACLGLGVNGLESQVFFTSPRLPAPVHELRVLNLDVGCGTVDLMFVRNRHDVSVDVLRRDGDVQIVVVK
jgi:glycogen debranching enzyme